MIRYALAAAAAVIACGPAVAATYTVDVTFDPVPAFANQSFGVSSTLAAPFMLVSGDSVILNIDFATPVAVPGEDELLIYLGLDSFRDNPAGPNAISGTYKVLGNFPASFAAEGTGFELLNGCCDVFVFRPGTTAADSVWTGLQFNFTVIGASSQIISSISLNAQTVPEPRSWALMIAGFGIAGAGARRTKAAKTRLSFG